MFNKKFTNNGIRTAGLWWQKQQLCQLRHNHFPLEFSLQQSTLQVLLQMAKLFKTISFWHNFKRVKFGLDVNDISGLKDNIVTSIIDGSMIVN